MGISAQSILGIPKVNVITTQNRAINAEEAAELALSKILAITDANMSAELKAQAHAYRDIIKLTVFHYINVAMQAERRTIVTAVEKAGQTELANYIRGM